jgi:hypothetical protein
MRQKGAGWVLGIEEALREIVRDEVARSSGITAKRCSWPFVPTIDRR